MEDEDKEEKPKTKKVVGSGERREVGVFTECCGHENYIHIHMKQC